MYFFKNLGDNMPNNTTEVPEVAQGEQHPRFQEAVSTSSLNYPGKI